MLSVFTELQQFLYVYQASTVINLSVWILLTSKGSGIYFSSNSFTPPLSVTLLIYPTWRSMVVDVYHKIKIHQQSWQLVRIQYLRDNQSQLNQYGIKKIAYLGTRSRLGQDQTPNITNASLNESRITESINRI